MLIKVYQLGEQDEIVPAALCLCAGGAMQGWAEQAGWLPPPLFAGVQMSKAAAQPVSQLLCGTSGKVLVAPSNLPGNRNAVRYTGALFLRFADGHFFSPAHILLA